jgi:nucleoside-diphosphate-sugar epimerase
MRSLITGAAGFIGRRLVGHYSLEHLAGELIGHLVGLTAARREKRA